MTDRQTLSRRALLLSTGSAGLAIGLSGRADALYTAMPDAGRRGPTRGYGPLVRDPRGLLDLPLPRIPGPHQVVNAGTAVRTIRSFLASGPSPSVVQLPVLARLLAGAES